jgi:hypothetical protein
MVIYQRSEMLTGRTAAWLWWRVKLRHLCFCMQKAGMPTSVGKTNEAVRRIGPAGADHMIECDNANVSRNLCKSRGSADGKIVGSTVENASVDRPALLLSSDAANRQVLDLQVILDSVLGSLAAQSRRFHSAEWCLGR